MKQKKRGKEQLIMLKNTIRKMHTNIIGIEQLLGLKQVCELVLLLKHIIILQMKIVVSFFVLIFYFNITKMINSLRNARIYKLVSKSTPKVYVGFTTLPLQRRLAYHYTNFGSTSAKEVLEYDDAEIIELEMLESKTYSEITEIEGEYIRKTPYCNNRIKNITANKSPAEKKVLINRMAKEWYQENKPRHNKSATIRRLKQGKTVKPETLKKYEINPDDF